ncbi:MAG: hypothetical protein D6691_04185 [Candidatus Hydrogenedentota bacterium]|nr:MAG: hypothetical protein D6691_04185 [Candidatus Hydrogenedentota bacterium]
MKPQWRLEFGENQWLCHLGGAFLGPEKSGSISWNWLGNSPGWCVLPKIPPECHLAVRLEVAPFVPYDSLLWKVEVYGGNVQLQEDVFPVTMIDAEVSLSLPLELLNTLGRTRSPYVPLRLRMTRVPEPRLELRLNNLPVGELAFEPKSVFQTREFLIRRELLTDQNTLFFSPNFALPEHPGGETSAERRRRLSFRFFRMELFPLT